MSTDPISEYRRELRAAAVYRVRSHRRRRRVVVVLATAVGAILVVGGAIAAQSTWLHADSSGQIALTAVPERFDRAPMAFVRCMAAHGARRVDLPGGGWTYHDATDAEASCGAAVTGISVTCPPAQPSGRPEQCRYVVHRDFRPPLHLTKR